MRLGLSWTALLWGCGTRPVALFTVECADDDCDALTFAVQAGGGGDRFVWSVDGVPASTEPSYEHPGNPNAAEWVTLRSVNIGGSDVRGIWVAANPVLTLGAEGDWEQAAFGFTLVEEKGRTVDTECGPLAIVTSIGGCFTGTQEISLHRSHANLGLVAPPSPLSSANYEVPATFVPGVTPDITRGGWDGARAFIGGPPLAVDWDPLLDSIVTTSPRFEVATTLATPGDTHWAILEVPGVGFHQNGVLVECAEDQWEVGSAAIDEASLNAWAGRQ